MPAVFRVVRGTCGWRGVSKGVSGRGEVIEVMGVLVAMMAMGCLLLSSL